MKRAYTIGFVLLFGAVCAGVSVYFYVNQGPGYVLQGRESAEEATVSLRSREAFGTSLPNLPTKKLRDFTFGNRLFNTKWVIPPASVESLDGLGPLFNRRSCSGCHFKDGRGRPPKSPEDRMMSMLVRLSVGSDSVGKPVPHPVYGSQLQNRAVQGLESEGRVSVTYEMIRGAYPDGETYTLRSPSYTFKDLGYGPLGEDVKFSPRVAPAIHGLGLVESVPDGTILGLADPNDRDGDGISGKPNWIGDPDAKGTSLGRFGWKANVPTLRAQAEAAAATDLGITTSAIPDEPLTSRQEATITHRSGGKPELNDTFVRKLAFYEQTLGVPARRNVEDPTVKRGQGLFYEIGCQSCHHPRMKTGTNETIPELSNQTIWPYSDFLLHDMGDSLADHRRDYQASGSEWRTPPLWGIGLVKVVNRHTFFLHDGRARNLEEAILWHGGEATKSRRGFKHLQKSDREALLVFLKSL